MLQKSNNSLLEWIINKKNKKIKDFDSFNIHDDKSDLGTLLNIFNNFKQSFNYLDIFKIDNIEDIKLKLKDKFNKYRDTYLSLKKNSKFSIINPLNSDIPEETYKKLAELDSKNELFNKNSFNKIIFNDKVINKPILEDINKNEKKINLWCQNNYIDNNTLNKFLLLYYDNKKNILTIDRDNEDYQDEKLKWFEDNLSKFSINKSSNKIDSLIKIFMFSNPSNIAIKNEGYGNSGNSYILLDKQEKDFFTYMIKPRFRNSKELETSLKYPNKVIMYNSKMNFPNSTEINLQIISNIEVKWLIETFPNLYNPLFMKLAMAQRVNSDLPVSNFLKQFIHEIINKFNPILLDNFSNNKGTPIINEYFQSIKKNIRKIEI